MGTAKQELMGTDLFIMPLSKQQRRLLLLLDNLMAQEYRRP